MTALKRLATAREIARKLWRKALAAEGVTCPDEAMFVILSTSNPYERAHNRAIGLLQRELLRSLGRDVPPWSLG